MRALKDQITALLASSPHAKSPEAEAERILFHLKRKYDLADAPEKSLRFPLMMEEALELARDRARGTPIQHLLGWQYFYEHEYEVDDSTLIPRPETEILIDEALKHLRARSASIPFRFYELGVGSGVLSAEILSHFEGATGVGSEIDPRARSLSLRNLATVAGQSFPNRFTLLPVPDPLTGFEIFVPFGLADLVISNPPYLSKQDEFDPEVARHEPSRALVPEGSENPSWFYENFLEHSESILAPGGAAFFEVPHERAESILAGFLDRGFSNSRLIPDLTGRSRVLHAERK
jgi:release factor glutamine methyltransferase